MTRRYVLAPGAALDLVPIWRYIKKQSSVEIADRVESVGVNVHAQGWASQKPLCRANVNEER